MVTNRFSGGVVALIGVRLLWKKKADDPSQLRHSDLPTPDSTGDEILVWY